MSAISEQVSEQQSGTGTDASVAGNQKIDPAKVARETAAELFRDDEQVSSAAMVIQRAIAGVVLEKDREILDLKRELDSARFENARLNGEVRAANLERDSIKETVERQARTIAGKNVKLVQERDKAVAFAAKVERGEVAFAKDVDAQMQAIADLSLGKTINENLAQAVARVLSERDTIKLDREKVIRERDEAMGKLKIVQRAVDIAEKINDAQTEQQAALSASLNEMMAYITLELTLAELAPLKQTISACVVLLQLPESAEPPAVANGIAKLIEERDTLKQALSGAEQANTDPAQICDCEDHAHGLVSNECPEHNLYPAPNAEGGAR